MPTKNAKKAMLEDAVELLGIASEKEKEKIVYDMIGYENGKKIKKEGENGLRNFISNNVVESSRFKYLVRYANIKTIGELRHNEKLIAFAIGNIPDEQIERYYKACMGGKISTIKDQRIVLARRISEIMFDNVKVENNNPEDSKDIIKKEQNKALIGLYLTLLYHIVKNLVYINSRYVMAFHCLERDYEIFYNAKLKNNDEYVRLTEDAIKYKDADEMENHRGPYIAKNKKAVAYLKMNLKNYDPQAFRQYRNNIAHLNHIRNIDKYIGNIKEISAYFDIYHYLAQRELKQYFKNKIIKDDSTGKYFKVLDEHKTYVKDFVKALNAPFGYNYARFKSLSIEGIFDKNNTKEKIEE